MSFEEAVHKVQHPNYWKRSYYQWAIETWDQFFFNEFPDSTKQVSHSILASEIKVLIENLESRTRRSKKLINLKQQLKKFGNKNNENKENNFDTSIKRKVIEKDKSQKKSKIISEKTKKESPTIPGSSIKISLSEIVLNTIPNLIYLDLCNKSNSSTMSIEQRFPDKITKPFFRTRNITCEKDIWSATDANIFDTLTSLDQSIYFLDGHALKNVIGGPDFVIVDNEKKLLIPWESKTKWVLNVLPDQNIITLYNEEKKNREEQYAHSSDVSVYHPINQIYGYMCANELRHAPFLEKPIMVADNTDEESDSPDKEQKGDAEFKYKGNLLPKSLNIVTRSQDH
ncbi:hypothetical protein GLOIN_2v1763835 [Rhizophagus clarus]|uniref:Uncharacterized protein n=1 Tax=Rhizophagus clarus TaxID=94130 RepID=A0A8H3QLK2_9GLOM|nr:hypothetical protein GLOIN_2v1763835 [Rhizophagus clarus]